ncbi:hypothetical protein D917_10711, partial [Trichinella nativa]
LSEISVRHPALVVRGLGHSCLLENDFLIEHGVKVDFSNQTVHIRNRTFHFYSEERRLWRKRQTMKFERVATRTVSDGVFFSEDKQNKVNLRRKLVVPKLIRSQALEALHDCLYAGHFGEKHTWESLKERRAEMVCILLSMCGEKESWKNTASPTAIYFDGIIPYKKVDV